MLVLRTSPASPFGRKISMALAVTGLAQKVQVLNANTSDENDSLRQQNPLGKIPILLLENGEALFDSRVIIEYLNELDGRGILIPAGPTKVGVLKQQALADGILDAAILQVYETRFRPEEHYVARWLDHQKGKVERALNFAESSLTAIPEGPPHIGRITLAIALDYLDLRFAGEWRATHPLLVDWLAEFSQKFPAFGETSPKLAS